MTLPHAHLDFETYSELDLRKVGSCRYAEHPSTEVLCAAWAIGGEVPAVWVPQRGRLDLAGEGLLPSGTIGDPPEALFEHVARGGLVYAWNVEFEIPIWERVCVERMGWPSVPQDQWRDTGAVALKYALPANLEGAGAALGLDVVKDKRGAHLVHKLSKPRRPSKHDPSIRWTPAKVPQDFADFYEYCRQDVRAERAVGLALPAEDLDPLELQVWRLTVEMNLRGWAVDAKSVDLMLELLEFHRERRLSELRQVTGGEIRTDNQRDKILAWLGERRIFLPDWTADTIERELKGEGGGIARDLPPDARRVLEIRRDLGKASTKKYVAMLDRRCDDGTVKNNLLYHGASTGRDAGRGMQIHNFPRAAVSKSQEGIEVAFRVLRSRDNLEAVELLYETVPHFASKMLRPMLVASPGRILYSADYSSIENVVTVWIAECPYGIDLFRRELDEYKMFATHFYDVAYDRVDADQRQRCKPAVLGCCFGLGWIGMMIQAERFGEPIKEQFAHDIVDRYRSLYPEVVDTWYGLAKAAMHTIKTGNKARYKRVKFLIEGEFLKMRLPSGRELAYREPLVEKKMTPWGQKVPTVTHMGVDSKTKKWVRMKITPGRFLENAVQATARDIMMHGALAAHAMGYDPVGRVHDEVISEVDQGCGSVEEYVELLTRKPGWLDAPPRGPDQIAEYQIPVRAEGWRGRRYRK